MGGTGGSREIIAPTAPHPDSARLLYGFCDSHGFAMTGPAPKPAAQRRRTNTPARGEWKPTPGIGWQHSKKHPDPPVGLKPESLVAWKVWMSSWFAAHWTPDDLPGLRILVTLYDEVVREEFQRATELRIQMDTYGITPKGQQDRRWEPPKAETVPESPAAAPAGPYGELKAV